MKCNVILHMRGKPGFFGGQNNFFVVKQLKILHYMLTMAIKLLVVSWKLSKTPSKGKMFGYSN